MKRAAAAESAAATVTVESLSHEGRGVARLGGKTVFIEGALPGETVRLAYLRRRRTYHVARAIEVIDASPARVRPRCPAFGTCGGCALQHLRPEAQRRAKTTILLDVLRRIGKVTPQQVLSPIEGPAWGYRRRARLGVRYVPKKGGVLVGFRERARSFVADTERCDVLDPRAARLLPALRRLIEGLSQPTRIPQVEVVAGDADCALVFRHLVPLTEQDETRLQTFGAAYDVQIYVQSAGPESVRPLWPPQPAPLSYRLPEHEIEIRFAPTDFVQVNAEVNRAMVDRVLELLVPGSHDRVLDLFAGLGNFTLPIARRCAHVVGLEADAALVARARQNAALNGLENVGFHTADLEEEGTLEHWNEPRCTRVVLDPPRTGALQVVKAIGRLGPERIVYVSCNPATLARDAGILVHVHRYRLAAAGILDMFPHTAHAEAVAAFVKTP